MIAYLVFVVLIALFAGLRMRAVTRAYTEVREGRRSEATLPPRHFVGNLSGR